jgi:hypothetical protein
MGKEHFVCLKDGNGTFHLTIYIDLIVPFRVLA